MPISKSLLILGTPRSGKTTLAEMIADRYGFSFKSTDALVQTFREVLPELEMHLEPNKSESKLAPFLFKYMYWTAAKPAFGNRNYVFEGCHISPKTANQMIDKNLYNLVVLGCPSLTPEQFVQEIKSNDKPYDWTYKKSDEELYQMGQDYINSGKQAESECKELGIKFIDTSFDRESKLKEFVDSLEDFLK